MLKFIKNRLKGDRADSNLVSIVIVIPLIMAVFFGIIDASAYFTNRSQIYSAAHSGARTVAIMGGNGTALQSTKIENKYGMTTEETCGKLVASEEDKAVAKVIKRNRAVECNIMKGFQNSSSFINVSINSIECFANEDKKSQAQAIGDRAYCEIKWTYNGTPGSALSMINLFKENTTSASVESEVQKPGLTNRR